MDEEKQETVGDNMLRNKVLIGNVLILIAFLGVTATVQREHPRLMKVQEELLYHDFFNVQSGSSSTAPRQIINGIGPFGTFKAGDRIEFQIGS